MQLLRFTAAVMLVFLLNECNSPAVPLTEHKALGSVVQDLHDTSKTDLDAIRLWPAYKNYLGKLPDSLTGFFCFRGNTKQQAVALTFDDGPMASTPQLMLLLKKYNAPAAFFCLAQQITVQNASWYKDTLFTLALHSYSHINYDKTGPEKMRSEIKSSITIAERMGFKPRYFRPPYGIINAEEVKALKDAHLRGVIWSIDSEDWNNHRKNGVVENVLTHLQPGSIILFHDRVSLFELETILKELIRRKYKIVPLSELI